MTARPARTRVRHRRSSPVLGLTVRAIDAISSLKARLVDIAALLDAAVENANEAPVARAGRDLERALALMDLAYQSAELGVREAEELSHDLHRQLERVQRKR